MGLLDQGLKITSDVVFQYIFSSQGSEPGLLGFINAVQADANRLPAKEIVIRNPFNPRHSFDDKSSILDIKATDSLNRTYDIEMQSVNKEAFIPRILYYWSGVYHDQMQAGEPYTVLYPVISMILTEFEMFPQLEELHNVFNLVPEKNPNFRLTDHMQIHTLEFAGKKLLQLPQIARPLRHWADFLINGNAKTEEEMETLAQGIPGLDAACAKLREFSQSDELRELAIARQKAERDKIAEISFAKNEGIAEGIAEGMAKGIAKGMAEGIAKGRVEGIAEGRVEGMAEGMAKATLIKLLQVLKVKFPQEFTPELEAAISRITDPQRLDVLFTEALMAGQIEDVAKLL